MSDLQPRDLVLRRSGAKNSCWPKFGCAVASSLLLILGVKESAFIRRGSQLSLPSTVPSGPVFHGKSSGPVLLHPGPGLTPDSLGRPGQFSVEAPKLGEAGAVLTERAVKMSEVPLLQSGLPPVRQDLMIPNKAATDALVVQPLPNCSVVFFHHLEKTAGTTLRSVLQRHAQLGLFDFFSFVNRYDKVQFQMVTHRLDSLIDQPGGLEGLRLAVEIHIGGGGYEQFLRYTLPDLLLLRAKLRTAGCRCNLVTLLRHPLLAHVSWHHHFVNHRVPLCFWDNPHDCQSRMSMALACHGGPSIRPLTENHRKAVGVMWDSFDLVGLTEYFDEFMVLLTDLVGLQRPEYRSQMASAQTTAAREAAQQW